LRALGRQESKSIERQTRRAIVLYVAYHLSYDAISYHITYRAASTAKKHTHIHKQNNISSFFFSALHSSFQSCCLTLIYALGFFFLSSFFFLQCQSICRFISLLMSCTMSHFRSFVIMLSSSYNLISYSTKIGFHFFINRST